MTTIQPIELGKKYKDTVSGWEGIATLRLEFLNGCIRYELSGKDKDGAPQGHVFDEEQLLLVEDELAPLVVATPTRTGGDRPTPARHSVSAR